MLRLSLSLVFLLFISIEGYAEEVPYYGTNYSNVGNTSNSGNFYQKVSQLPPAPSFNNTFIPPNGNSGWQAGITSIFGGFLFGRTKVDRTSQDLNEANADIMYLQGLQMITQCYTPECNQYRVMVYNRFKQRNQEY